MIVNFECPEGLIGKIDEMAKKRTLTRSAMLRSILLDFFIMKRGFKEMTNVD